jgi:hypothetical protein
VAPVDFLEYAAVVLGYAMDSLKGPYAEQVELLSWKSIKDIAGDGGVIKIIETEGKGWEKPRDKDEALGGSPCFTAETLQAAAVYNRPAAGRNFSFKLFSRSRNLGAAKPDATCSCVRVA